MKQIPCWALALSVFLWTSGALADEAISGKLTVEVDSKSRSGTSIYINAEQCRKDVTVKFHLTGLSSPDLTVVETWRGTKGVDCNAQAGREMTAKGHSAPCELIDSTTDVATSLTVSFKVSELFDCRTGEQTVFFVPLDIATPEDAEKAPESLSKDVYRVRFKVDVDAPDGLEDLEPLSGQREIGATWDASEAVDAHGYTMYFDRSGVGRAGDDCVSELLEEGSAPGTDKDLKAHSTTSARGVVPPKDLGLAVSEQIPVAVTVKDQAGNESALSPVVCARYVETGGFAKRYDAAGGDGLRGCSVSAFPTHSSHAYWTLSGLAVCGAIARRRRLRGRLTY